MKKALSFILLLIMIINLAACTHGAEPAPTAAPEETSASINTDEPETTEEAEPAVTDAPEIIDTHYTYDPATDVDNRYANAFCAIAELDNMFLWADYETPICFYDKEADFSGLICTKPECDHTDFETCNATVAVKSLCCYDDKIYFLPSFPDFDARSWYIFRMNMDFSDREIFMKIPYEEDGSITLKRIYIHRGVMYFTNEYQAVEDGKPVDKYELLACSLEKHNAEDLETVFAIDSDGWFAGSLFFAGDKIYLFTCPTIDGHYRLMVWMYDTVTGEKSLRADVIIDDDYFWTCNYWVTQEGDLLVGQGATLKEQNVKAYRIVNNELEVYMEFEEEEDYKWWQTFFDDETVCATAVVSENPRQDAIWIKDHDGNTIYKGLLPSLGEYGFTYDKADLTSPSCDRIIKAVRDETRSDKSMYYLVEYDLTENGFEQKILINYDSKTGIE